ncbi:MAG: S8 family peptidase [Defluviitaleaceae bacterium]|nr:S8 family peptidase [Defluviitaleaceae bacterium]
MPVNIQDLSLNELVTSPDIVPFVVRTELITEEYLAENPYVRAGMGLAGGYQIIYTNRANVGRVKLSFGGATHLIHPPVYGLMGTQALTASGITQVQQHPVLNLRGSGVIIGFVDTGIDYTQNAFRYEDGTSKIIAIWDQCVQGKPPEDFICGAEYSNEQINEALRSDNPYDILPHEDTVGHGTFLASVAASRENGQNLGAAPDSEIIVVKLRPARPFSYEYFLIPPTVEEAYSGDDIAMGVQYILEKSRSLGRPVVICIGLGTNFGSHNGFSVFETYLSTVASVRGVAICVAAGNEGNAGHHTMGKLERAGDSQDMELRVGTARQDILISIWNSAIDRISVSITSPTGENIARVPARSGASVTQRLVLEQSTVSVDYEFPVQRSGEQVTLIRILSATQGIWRITVHADSILNGTYHAWLPISNFIDPNIQFLSPIPNYTVTVPGSAMGVITCGSYNSQTNSLASTGSWGPTRLPSIAPDLTAPGENVSGIYPWGPGAMSGTSVSTAITTGACALLMEWGIVQGNEPMSDTSRIRSNLIAGCERDPANEYPNYQWGFGKLNLMGAFRMLRPL